MSISSRLAALEAAAESAKSGKIRVDFRDGHTEYVDGVDAVVMASDLATTAVHFAAAGPGHGLLPDILNELLTCM